MANQLNMLLYSFNISLLTSVYLENTVNNVGIRCNIPYDLPVQYSVQLYKVYMYCGKKPKRKD